MLYFYCRSEGDMSRVSAGPGSSLLLRKGQSGWALADPWIQFATLCLVPVTAVVQHIGSVDIGTWMARNRTCLRDALRGSGREGVAVRQDLLVPPAISRVMASFSFFISPTGLRIYSKPGLWCGVFLAVCLAKRRRCWKVSDLKFLFPHSAAAQELRCTSLEDGRFSLSWPWSSLAHGDPHGKR